ncbi:sigma-54 interaction domain-containing protein [Desulforhopalus singaporensis]|nr:sigma 54-interacting transcriptional regulator [Desulforhopalus singaporensis]
MEEIDWTAVDLSLLLSKFHEGILVTESTGKILYYNQSMSKVDDIEPEYAIGKNILDVYDLTKEQSPTMRCLTSLKPVLNEPMFYRTHLGKVTNAILNVYPLFSRKVLVGAICFVNEYHTVERKFSTISPLRSPKSEKENGTRFTFSDIIGRRTDLAESVRFAQMAAESTSSVLITGETGTGKELFAQSIHNLSNFKKNQFVPINCAAIPENLLEGILFGTSKGAFTGAIEKAGLFEQANGGTLFLDELNSMPVSLQTKLLRVIQEMKIRRIGSHKEINIDLKIISSVNNDPIEEIKRGNLRVDLFYRVGVVSINIPPLRERKRDITKLINHFIDKFNLRQNKNVSGIAPEVQKYFTHYRWPGNVRELEHVLEGAMNFVDRGKFIETCHLPQHFLRSNVVTGTVEKKSATKINSNVSSRTVLNTPLNEFCKTTSKSDLSLQELDAEYCAAEKQIIRRVLLSSKGNIARAAKNLGLGSPQALLYKMKKLGLNRSEFRKQKIKQYQ